MATLQIRPYNPVEARAATVTITLCDSTGAQVTGYSSSGELIAAYNGRTSAAGVLDVDVTPNADVTPANTYYRVVIDGRASIIEKSGSTQTVLGALAASPSDLSGISVGNIDGGRSDSVYTGLPVIDGGDST